VHYVGADPTGATRPLLPIRSIVGAVFDLDPQRCTTRDLGRAANLSGLAFEELPGLAELFALEGPARGLEHAVRRRECLASAVQSLLTAGTGEPVLLIFDDIDGFDPPSREILRRLAHHNVQRPVVVLASTAEADTAWLTPHRHELAQLSPQEAADLCGQLAGDLRPGSNLASRIDIPSPCTALHLEARLRLMASGVAFTPGEDERELLRKWLDQLPVSTRRVLQCAAVLGERMHESDLADLAERDPLPADDNFEEGLARLHVEGVLLVIGGGERAFSHPMLQQVAHRTLTPARAATLHDLAAKYSRLARSSLAVRAIHLLAAGAEGAADALEAAADEAERAFGDQAASDYLQAALQALGRNRADPARLHAQARIATKLARVVRAKGQAAAGLTLTEAHLKDTHTHADQARLHHARGRYLARLGRHDEAETALRQSLSAAILQGDREQMLDLYRELSEECTRRGNLQGAIVELQEGLDLCTLGEGPRARLELPLWRYLLAISAAVRASGHPAEARPWCTHALFQADQDGDLLGQMRCHAELGVLMRDTSQPLLAEQHTARALEHARYFGDRLSTSELLLERARLRAARGEVAEARHSCDEALRLAKVVEWKAGVRAAERALELLASQST
jgi:serine/threonine-protein kinase